MKICAVIAEYNPFHLGHLRQLEYIKKDLGAEKLIVIMSGNFTQRGEIAVLDKFTRAKHAVKAGADLVLELPTVFATANAEIFAKGAVGILNSLNVVDGLCFGAETDAKQGFIDLALALNDESKEFKKALKSQLDKGFSLAKAKLEAVKSLGGVFDESLCAFPNNILGLEYTKAILSLESHIDIFPLLRGGSHNDKTLKKGETSATSIREVIKTGKFKKLSKNLPKYVYHDLTNYPFTIDKMIMTKLLTTTNKELAEVIDCTEGLENRLKALSKDNLRLDNLVEKAVTKRYGEPRIRRILLSNLLGVKANLVKDALSSPLYAKVLAVKEGEKSLVATLCSNSSIPIITRSNDVKELKKTALACYEIDVLANELYGLASSKPIKENHMLIID